MFNNLLELIENAENHEKMPVRKFFNNTFGTLLNDAIFELKKKQEKTKNMGLMTMQGQVRFVAHFLQDHLPDNEPENLPCDIYWIIYHIVDWTTYQSMYYIIYQNKYQMILPHALLDQLQDKSSDNRFTEPKSQQTQQRVTEQKRLFRKKILTRQK